MRHHHSRPPRRSPSWCPLNHTQRLRALAGTRDLLGRPSAVGVASLCSCFDAMFGKYLAGPTHARQIESVYGTLWYCQAANYCTLYTVLVGISSDPDTLTHSHLRHDGASDFLSACQVVSNSIATTAYPCRPPRCCPSRRSRSLPRRQPASSRHRLRSEVREAGWRGPG